MEESSSKSSLPTLSPTGRQGLLPRVDELRTGVSAGLRHCEEQSDEAIFHA